MVDRIKYEFIVLVLPTKSVFKLLKHAVHNIHILAWAHMLVGLQETAQCAHALRRHCLKGGLTIFTFAIF